MAKCSECKSCLEVIRLDFEPDSIIYWYCPVCNSVFQFYNRTESINDPEIKKLVRERRIQLKGNVL